jgi:diguanylate cyclase (GGDEF)-like protein
MKFSTLPLLARLYVGLVAAAGLVLAAVAATQGAFQRPLVLAALVVASIVFHTVKIELTASTSTLSLGYAVTFASLLILGGPAAILTTMAGGWAQCTLNTKVKSPWYQTVFSISALLLSMESAALTLAWTGGRALNGPADIVVPSVMASALAYFAVNSLLMAMVIALTSGRPVIRVWDRDFLWGAPNYVIGAFVATAAVQSVSRFGVSSVVVLAPLFFTYRLYKSYVGRIAESHTDPLTQLPNRRFLASHAETEIARAARSGQPLSLIMVDVDRFKLINDTYGHQKGDEVLNLIADCLRRGLRPYDLCARYAGDEFVLILSGCTSTMAAQRADDLAAAIEGASPAMAGDKTLAVSASIGVASYPTDGRTYEDLVAAADARMYQRKHLASSLVAAPNDGST